MHTPPSRFQVLKFPLAATPQNRVAIVLPGVLLLLALCSLLIPVPHFHLQLDFTLSCILSLTNAFLGYVFIERAFRMNMKLSILLLLGGMTFRFFLLLTAIALILVSTPVGIGSFVGSFMVMYAVTLFAEVFYINHKTDQLRLAAIPVRK